MDGSQPNVETSRRRSAPAALEAAGAALAVVREVHARGEAGTRSRSHSTPSLRSGSVAGSSQRGSPSKRGGSKRSPSKSCGMGDVFSRQAASQEVVLRALVRSFTVEQSVHDVAVNLLGQIHSKEGAIAFTRESISQAVTASEASMQPAESKVDAVAGVGAVASKPAACTQPYRPAAQVLTAEVQIEAGIRLDRCSVILASGASAQKRFQRLWGRGR
mmetsp:Transcript_1318/g.3091  ORF Transcript_1318/g.3091 Transcript_1318/m.3091 type:complete len:217 (-) Transcript_1318:720-1370(-)